jgi:hypothetical protein
VEIAAPPPKAVAAEPEERRDERTCHAVLWIEDIIRDRPECYVDVHLRGEPGELVYPCAGGRAEARFRSAVFRGAVRGGTIELALGTRFDWEDGCAWTSTQRIEGSLAGKSLGYVYSEAPAPDQEGCLPACGARARVRVVRQAPR